MLNRRPLRTVPRPTPPAQPVERLAVNASNIENPVTELVARGWQPWGADVAEAARHLDHDGVVTVAVATEYVGEMDYDVHLIRAGETVPDGADKATVWAFDSDRNRWAAVASWDIRTSTTRAFTPAR